MPWAPAILSYARFSRPLLMPFPPAAMPFPSSPLVLYLNIPSWLKACHLFFEGLPDPRRHDRASFVHHRATLRRSPLWGLRGVLHVCSSSYVHTSLDSMDCASQKALKHHQNKIDHLLNFFLLLYTLYVTYVISNSGKKSTKQSISISQNEN